MARPASLKKGQWDQFERVLFASDVTAEEILQITEKPELLKLMLTALRAHRSSNPIHGLFTPASAQLTRVRELNIERGWGFTDEDFATAEASAPNWPAGNLVAVTLVPYLSAGYCMGDVARTFQELWQVAASLQQSNWRWEGYDKAGPGSLRLLKGIEHPAKDKPVLHWEVIDLGCNRNRKPVDVRNLETSPHAGILASAMLHPEWVKAMDGDKVPYVWAPGYEVNVSGGLPWQVLPDLSFDRGDRGIELGYDWCDGCSSGWSVPSFARE